MVPHRKNLIPSYNLSKYQSLTESSWRRRTAEGQKKRKIQDSSKSPQGVTTKQDKSNKAENKNKSTNPIKIENWFGVLVNSDELHSPQSQTSNGSVQQTTPTQSSTGLKTDKNQVENVTPPTLVNHMAMVEQLSKYVDKPNLYQIYG